jgi:hypothetical protein
MPRRNGHACHARDIGVGPRAYDRDIGEAEIDQLHRDALKAIRATNGAGLIDATRGWGTFQTREAQMPRGWK